MDRALKPGFTLIELLLVISIISLLSSIIFASLSDARAKSRDARRFSDFQAFQTALELFYDSYGVYPCGDGDHEIDMTIDHSSSFGFLNSEVPPTTNCTFAPTIGLYDAGFLSTSWPKDPINDEVSYFYSYTVTGDRQTYLLTFWPEVDTERAANDGGICGNLYEAGSGVGVMTPAGDVTCW